MQENRVRIFFKNFNFDLNSNHYYVFLIAGISFILDSSLHHFFCYFGQMAAFILPDSLTVFVCSPLHTFFLKKKKNNYHYYLLIVFFTGQFFDTVSLFLLAQ